MCKTQSIQILLNLYTILPPSTTRKASTNGQRSWKNRQLSCESIYWAQSIQIHLNLCTILPYPTTRNPSINRQRSWESRRLRKEGLLVLGAGQPDTPQSTEDLASDGIRKGNSLKQRWKHKLGL